MSEKEEQQRRFDELQAAAQREKDIADKRVITMEDFEEDWQISQVGLTLPTITRKIFKRNGKG